MDPLEVIDLAAGARHVCAARRNGSVVCWGANATGDLGESVDSGMRGWMDRTPFVAPVEGAVRVVARGSRTSAYTAAGRAT